MKKTTGINRIKTANPLTPFSLRWRISLIQAMTTAISMGKPKNGVAIQSVVNDRLFGSQRQNAKASVNEKTSSLSARKQHINKEVRLGLNLHHGSQFGPNSSSSQLAWIDVWNTILLDIVCIRLGNIYCQVAPYRGD